MEPEQYDLVKFMLEKILVLIGIFFGGGGAGYYLYSRIHISKITGQKQIGKSNQANSSSDGGILDIQNAGRDNQKIFIKTQNNFLSPGIASEKQALSEPAPNDPNIAYVDNFILEQMISYLRKNNKNSDITDDYNNAYLYFANMQSREAATLFIRAFIPFAECLTENNRQPYAEKLSVQIDELRKVRNNDKGLKSSINIINDTLYSFFQDNK